MGSHHPPYAECLAEQVGAAGLKFPSVSPGVRAQGHNQVSLNYGRRVTVYRHGLKRVRQAVWGGFRYCLGCHKPPIMQ